MLVKMCGIGYTFLYIPYSPSSFCAARERRRHPIELRLLRVFLPCLSRNRAAVPNGIHLAPR